MIKVIKNEQKIIDAARGFALLSVGQKPTLKVRDVQKEYQEIYDEHISSMMITYVLTRHPEYFRPVYNESGKVRYYEYTRIGAAK